MKSYWNTKWILIDPKQNIFSEYLWTTLNWNFGVFIPFGKKKKQFQKYLRVPFKMELLLCTQVSSPKNPHAPFSISNRHKLFSFFIKITKYKKHSLFFFFYHPTESQPLCHTQIFLPPTDYHLATMSCLLKSIPSSNLLLIDSRFQTAFWFHCSIYCWVAPKRINEIVKSARRWLVYKLHPSPHHYWVNVQYQLQLKLLTVEKSFNFCILCCSTPSAYSNDSHHSSWRSIREPFDVHHL